MPSKESGNAFNQVFPAWVWVVYLLLFALSIPWYLPENFAMNLVWGLPLWLICSVLSVVAIAIFTQWIISRYWKEIE